MRRAFVYLWLVALLALLVPAAAADPISFVVRHSEKAEDGGNDPELSNAGVTWAERLAEVLKDAGISAIYVTEFKRTQETASPLAKKLGISVTVVPAKETVSLVSQLRKGSGNALVVGHGNTIPDIMKGLGIATPIAIGESDYDNLFVVTLGQEPQLVRLHYR